MSSDIEQRISRIYAAISATEERDPQKLRAMVIQTDKVKAILQDFRGGLSDDDLSNQAHLVIHNIANLRDHLRRWAAGNSKDKNRVDQAAENCIELRVIQDLSNNDKHGYPPRDRGVSKRSPLLTQIDRVMRLQTQAKKGSSIAMVVGADGVPRFLGDGTAKAVVTGTVVDAENKPIGDLYEIASTAVNAWERLLVEFGLVPPRAEVTGKPAEPDAAPDPAA